MNLLNGFEKMGGVGSGNWYRLDRKTLVEDCLCLDVNQFNRRGYLQAGHSINAGWTGGANINVTTMPGAIELSYTVSSEPFCYQVPLTWTHCNYGGKRPWFVCPHCGSRRGKLYLNNKYFLCRFCHNLAYRSQRNEPIYTLRNKARRIYEKLGVNGFDDIKPKPKGMHWKTYNMLWDEVERLEELESRVFLAQAMALGARFDKLMRRLGE